MPRAKAYQKHIFCLEAEMDDRLTKDFSSRYMLEQLHNFSDIKYIHRKCATREELQYYLKKIKLARYRDYSIIYFSAHGEPNAIELGDGTLTLEELADYIGDSLQDKIFHFGSCETLFIKEELMEDFFRETNALMVSGFTKAVDFIEGAAMEMLYFSWCQEYVKTFDLEKKIQKEYPGLVGNTGFTMIHR